jgi:hypothetical protein
MSCLDRNHEWEWPRKREAKGTQVCTRCGALRVSLIQSRALAEKGGIIQSFDRSWGRLRREQGPQTCSYVLEKIQTPLAIQLYEKCVRGKSPAQLADETGIPIDRIRVRILAARTTSGITPMDSPTLASAASKLSWESPTALPLGRRQRR